MKYAGELIKIAVALALENKCHRDIASGILRYAASRPNWEVRLFTPSELAVCHETPLSALWRPDGLIAGGLSPSFKRPWRTPVVALDPPPSLRLRPEGTVLTDDAAIGKAAAEFLLAKHFLNFAYVSTQDAEERHHCVIREKNYVQRLADDGHSCRRINILDASGTTLRPRSHLTSDLNGLDKPCAIFAYSDIAARYVLDTCRYAGIPVPSAISILGVDNQCEITENTNPQLSSVVPNFEQSGFDAANMLDDILQGKRSKRKTVTAGIADIIDRASTCDKSGSRWIVYAALDYIRLHFHEQLKTASIARRLGMSSRFLEIRFRETLGQSVHGKITELRLAKAEQLVSKTSRPFSSIAELCGYASQQGLRKAFQSRFKCTMREWRKRKSRIGGRSY